MPVVGNFEVGVVADDCATVVGDAVGVVVAGAVV